MSTWLFIALSLSAALNILFGAFLGGSLRRWNLIWAGCLAALGVAVLALLLLASVDSFLSVFSFNPIRVAKRIWETSDQGVVIKGILAGVTIPVLGFSGFYYFFKEIRKMAGTLGHRFLWRCLVDANRGAQRGGARLRCFS